VNIILLISWSSSIYIYGHIYPKIIKTVIHISMYSEKNSQKILIEPKNKNKAYVL
jgi:hypothetical protein